MMVVNDEQNRVTLPTKPIKRFELNFLGEGNFTLTRLEPLLPTQITAHKVGRYTMGHDDRRLTEAALRDFLGEFPWKKFS